MEAAIEKQQGIWKYYPDLNFAVCVKPQEYHVDFEVYENQVWTETDGEIKPDPCGSFSEPEIYLHGSVKWDGCSNWHFDEQDRCMLHGCSREDLLRFGQIMAACWDLTPELLETWDG